MTLSGRLFNRWWPSSRPSDFNKAAYEKKVLIATRLLVEDDQWTSNMDFNFQSHQAIPLWQSIAYVLATSSQNTAKIYCVCIWRAMPIALYLQPKSIAYVSDEQCPSPYTCSQNLLCMYLTSNAHRLIPAAKIYYVCIWRAMPIALCLQPKSIVYVSDEQCPSPYTCSQNLLRVYLMSIAHRLIPAAKIYCVCIWRAMPIALCLQPKSIVYVSDEQCPSPYTCSQNILRVYLKSNAHRLIPAAKIYCVCIWRAMPIALYLQPKSIACVSDEHCPSPYTCSQNLLRVYLTSNAHRLMPAAKIYCVCIWRAMPIALYLQPKYIACVSDEQCPSPYTCSQNLLRMYLTSNAHRLMPAAKIYCVCIWRAMPIALCLQPKSIACVSDEQCPSPYTCSQNLNVEFTLSKA